MQHNRVPRQEKRPAGGALLREVAAQDGNVAGGDYRQWKGDWELWNGAAVSMTPSPFGRHVNMLARLVTSLTNGIDSAKCHASVLAVIDWIIAHDTVVRPDASVMCGDPPKGHIESAPAVVVEGLSDTTRERDLNQKRALYEDNAVAWYLIADPAHEMREL